MFNHAVATETNDWYETKDWYAWIDLMPPRPYSFHVIGNVYVGNPGVKAYLSVREPQGTNPNTLLLDLHLVQKYEVALTVMTWIQARFDEIVIPNSQKYTEVEIFSNNKSIAKVPVEEVY